MRHVSACTYVMAAALLAGCASNQVEAPAARNRVDAGGGDTERSSSGNPPFYEVFGKRYYVLDSSAGYRERGIASWYGREFQGKRTSGGERFDMHDMTAAHKTLPIPTWVEVTNLENGRSVVVKVNDRGPFVDDRIIDLSYRAAQDLDMIRRGTARVQVRALENQSSAPVTTTAAAAPRSNGFSIISEANAHLASAAESRKLAEVAQQRGDEKEARRFFDEEKTFRQLAEESRAYIEGEIRDGKVAECQPSRRPGYNLISDRLQISLSVTPLTAQLADFFNAAQDSLLITEVKAGELSERAGLKAGDCIVTVGGKTVKSTSDIDRLLNQESSGELEFVIVRDRKEQKIKLKLDQK